MNQLKLQKLYLYENNFSEIRKEYWEGLSSLIELKINDNRIEYIYPDGLSNLINLELLHLHNNNLRTLKSEVFGDSHPVKLEMSLVANPLRCDGNLCWMKQAERDGWLTWTPDHGPQCRGRSNRGWYEVEMECDIFGTLTSNI